MKEKLFPFLTWLPELRKTWRYDILAGLIGAVVVLPQGVAFAMIAGMPPQYGLYAAMVPTVIAALWGSSRHLISGPTTAISLVLFSSLSTLAEPGTQYYIELAMLLTLMAGLFQVGMGLLRLGGIINYVSHSVVLGFTAGAAILIATSQLKHFFGLQYKNAPHFVDNIRLFAEHAGQLNKYSLIVAVVTFIIVITVRRSVPKFPDVFTTQRNSFRINCSIPRINHMWKLQKTSLLGVRSKQGSIPLKKTAWRY